MFLPQIKKKIGTDIFILRTDVLHEVDVTEKIDDSKMLKTRKIGILKHMVKQADDLIRFLWSLSCMAHWLISWSEE